MKFTYHWRDRTGIEHFTDNRDEADQALHEGNLVMVVMPDRLHKNGSSRAGM